jgi:hypothetical protein
MDEYNDYYALIKETQIEQNEVLLNEKKRLEEKLKLEKGKPKELIWVKIK